MKNTILFLFLLCFFLSCKKEANEPLRVSLKYELISKDVLTTMPGSLIVSDSFLIWTDPFARDYFVHVHHAMTGDKIGVMGKVGEGPNEFISGGISRFCINNMLSANDANGNTEGYLSIDSLLLHRNSFVGKSEHERESDFERLDTDVYLDRTEDGDPDYFKSIIGGHASSFGVYPVLSVRQHVGGYKAYDAQEGYLAYTSFQTPYLALYQREGNGLNLLWEIKSSKDLYEVADGKIIFDRSIGGAKDVCFTKEYIVTLDRDRKYDQTDEATAGRDVRKCPHSVFLYDFDSKLVKIVDLGIPVIRIAADRRSNTLYAIGADPDYMLVKYEL